PCQGGSRTRASSPWRCSAGRTTSPRGPRRSRRGACRDVGVDELAVERLKTLDDRPAAAIADRATVDGPDGHDAGEGAGDERLAGGVYVREAERRLAGRDATGAADLEHVGARDPGEAVAAVGGQHLGRLVRAGDDEEVRRVARRHEA